MPFISFLRSHSPSLLVFVMCLSNISEARSPRVLNPDSGSNSGSSSGSSSFDSDRYQSSDYYGGGNTSGNGSNELGGNNRGGVRTGKYGALSYVETGGEYPRGRGIGRARLTCPGSGSFKWLFAPSRSCLSMGGSAELFQFLDRNFNKCVATGARAAGISSQAGNFTGRVYHKGIEGDRRHQGTDSLHNVGRAIDIASIEVNGVVMNHSVASKQARSGRPGKEYYFFKAFRQCWSQEVSAECPSARRTRAGYVGSIGWENRQHQGHMHISLPVCGQRGFYMTKRMWPHFFRLFSSVLAEAATPSRADKINLKLASGDVVTGQAEFVGEPVTEPVTVELQIKCRDHKVQVLEENLQVCDFISIKEEKKKMVLTYSVAEFKEKDGTFNCGPRETKQYENPCAGKGK